jgi:hypothetical protein
MGTIAAVGKMAPSRPNNPKKQSNAITTPVAIE